MKYPKNTIFFALTLALLAHTTTYTAEAAHQGDQEDLDLLSLEQLIEKKIKLAKDIAETRAASETIFYERIFQADDPFKKHFAKELKNLTLSEIPAYLETLKRELQRTDPKTYATVALSKPKTREELAEEAEEQSNLMLQLIAEITQVIIVIALKGGTPEHFSY